MGVTFVLEYGTKMRQLVPSEECVFTLNTQTKLTDKNYIIPSLESHMMAYREMSLLHSSTAMGLAGMGRKWVLHSEPGWSRLRTQHSSPDLEHCPAKAQCNAVRLQLPAGSGWK